jgi:hypothetical protein
MTVADTWGVYKLLETRTTNRNRLLSDVSEALGPKFRIEIMIKYRLEI